MIDVCKYIVDFYQNYYKNAFNLKIDCSDNLIVKFDKILFELVLKNVFENIVKYADLTKPVNIKVVDKCIKFCNKTKFGIQNPQKLTEKFYTEGN